MVTSQLIRVDNQLGITCTVCEGNLSGLSTPIKKLRLVDRQSPVGFSNLHEELYVRNSGCACYGLNYICIFAVTMVTIKLTPIPVVGLDCGDLIKEDFPT